MPTLTPDHALALKAAPAVERELCQRSLLYFMTEYACLLDRNTSQIVKWQAWPHLVQACHDLQTERRLIWLKSRHAGASWTEAGYAYWKAEFHPPSGIALLRQGETEAQQFLDMVKFIREHVPLFLRSPLKGEGEGNKSEMVWPNYSVIHAYPATKHAGRSATETVVIMDEADFHEFFEENYAALAPTVDLGKAQLIVSSTSNHETIDSGFKKLWRGAPGNNFKAVFWPWTVRPERDRAWFIERQKEATDKVRFSKEYPASAEEALAAPQTVMAFDRDALVAMQAECREAIAWQR